MLKEWLNFASFLVDFYPWNYIATLKCYIIFWNQKYVFQK